MNVTANDSKSTPKKAESQPRHPLALHERAWIALHELADQYASPIGKTPAQHAAGLHRAAALREDAAALRAQAEADRGAQETVRALVRRSENLGRCCGCGGEPHPIWENWEHYPGCSLAHALAQAGGES